MRTRRSMGQPSCLNEASVPALLRPGMRIFVQGLACESMALRNALVAQPGAAKGVHWFGALVPGINEFDYAALDPQARFSGLFIGPRQGATAADGRTELLPLHYSQAYRYFAAHCFDLVIIQVAPPDQAGMCSLGVNADFAESVIPTAAAVLAYVNESMPRTRGPAVPWAALDYVVPIRAELPSPPPASDVMDAITTRLAGHVAALVRNGDCLQMGIGKVPGAVLSQLLEHRHLGMHTGLVGNGVQRLIEAGVLTGDRKSVDRGLLVTNAVYGRRDLYDMASRTGFAFRSVAYTHAATVLAAIDNLVSINSAVEVDLLGQVNAESVGGRQISGVGGSVDFARGAAISRGGRAIVALPSLTSAGRSRIVARLSTLIPVTCSRADVGIVVTEHGSADLRGLTTSERTKALVGIADPSVREHLEREVASWTKA